MARVTPKERLEFHMLVDIAIAKLENPKNKDKGHWSTKSILVLQKMLMVEAFELDLAIAMNSGIEDECDDIINFALFIKHNLYKNNKAF